jgi:CDP-diacylglycerol--serine O-phosphatidyltransferase
VNLRERLVDPNSPDRRPRKAAYALPTLFTAGNIFLGYLSILRSFNGAMLAASGSAGAAEHFEIAARPSAPPSSWTDWTGASRV